MTFMFFLVIVTVLATIGLTAGWLIMRERNGKLPRFQVPGWAPLVAAGVMLLVVLFSSITFVGTRDIGVVTSFGRPVAYLDNGMHWKAPWESVSTLDGAIQTDSNTGDKNCTDIRIGNQSTACVDNSIRWRIKPEAADQLFVNYHTMDNIRDSLVTRELTAALNQVLSTYNPLNDIATNGTGAATSLNTFAAQVTADLQQQIGNQIEVLNVIIPIIRFDDSTQQKLNLYQAQIAQTRIAQQAVQTAKAEADANRVLAQSVNNDPNVLVSKCMDLVKTGVTLPAGFNCWPSGSSAVVVPSK